MKKNTMFILLLVLVLLAVLAYFLTGKKEVHSEVDISLKNTDQIHKIFLSDMVNNNIVLEKKGEIWTLNDTLEARLDAIESLKQTFRVQKPQQPVTAAQNDNVISALSTHGIKVIVYDKANKELLNFYVGGQGPKGIGTYMYKNGADKPYLYNANGFTGDLATRYFTKLDEWRSRKLFTYDPNSINFININYQDHPDSSFIVKGSITSRQVTGFNGQILKTTLGGINTYVNNFKSQMVTGWENSAFAKDSLINRNRYYGSMLIGTTKSDKVDTFKLYYCPAHEKSQTVRLIENQYYDLDYLFVSNNKNLGLLTTNSVTNKLVTPSSIK